LQKLQQQLQSRTHTYLYQIDGLLQAAADAVTAFNSQLAASTAAAGDPVTALLEICAQQLQQQDVGGMGASAAALQAAEALHGICCTIRVSQQQHCCTTAAAVPRICLLALPAVVVLSQRQQHLNSSMYVFCSLRA
jgi:hypothetical protein